MPIKVKPHMSIVSYLGSCTGHQNRKLLVLALNAVLSLTAFPQPRSVNLPSESSPQIRQLEAQHYVNYMLHVPFEELLASADKDQTIPVVARRSVDPAPNVGGASQDPHGWLYTEAANSDVIVVGRALKRTSDFVPDHSFLFTDYEIRVETVIKGLDPLYESRKVVVSRPGGSINVSSREFQAIESQMPQFQIDGRYLFFLRRIPETNTFMALVGDALLLQDGQVSTLRERPRYIFSPERETDLLNDLTNFVKSTERR